MQEVAEKAEEMQHHPKWTNEWNKVSVWLYTHSANAITDKDRELSEAIDAIAQRFLQGKGAQDFKKSVQINDGKLTTEVVKITEAKMYADGGSRGNPGPSASGYVLYDMSDKIVEKRGVYLGVTTNNQAEYQAVKFGLEAALEHNVRRLHVYLDSLLVVNQMIGKFKVKNRDLWPIHTAIKELTHKFEYVKFTHVPRALNKEADAAVNEALDAHLETQN